MCHTGHGQTASGAAVLERSEIDHSRKSHSSAQFWGWEHSRVTPLAIQMAGGAVQERSSTERLPKRVVPLGQTHGKQSGAALGPLQTACLITTTV